MILPYEQPKVAGHSVLILNSYRHWLSEDLLLNQGSDSERARILFEAPFVVVSHGTGKDPVLNYGNQMALTLWEMTWDSFIHTPSRLTAEIINRAERSKMLNLVNEQGYSKNYRGTRVTSSGKQFQIEQAVVWNILDAKGIYCGQAAAFHKWVHL